MRFVLLLLTVLLSFSGCGPDGSSTVSPVPATTYTPKGLIGTNCPVPQTVSRNQRMSFGAPGGPFCLVWQDSWNDETGFRIVLQYEGPNAPGERFDYSLPADTTEFLFPAADSPADVNPSLCLQRKDFGVTLLVVRPTGVERVDARSRILECRN